MMRSIIFDFDGVIVESAHIKTAAFRELYGRWPSDQAEAGVAYHRQNTGITRYVKFRHFFENILNEPYTAQVEKELAVQFEAIVYDQVIAAPLVPWVKEFLEKYAYKYVFFIASGTPEKELIAIVKDKGLEKHFRCVCGAPRSKEDIICSILAGHNYLKEDVVFIGDGESDRRAAKATGVNFIARATGENDDLVSATPKVINDFTQLEEVILSF